jgi:RNA polymerase sigma-70 factor, ECF subfamily
LAAGLAERLDSVMMVHPPRVVPESWESRFEKLYLEHYGRVVGVLFRLISSRSEAEELSNEVFWKLYRQRLLPNPDGNVGGWLYRTATNLGIDALRKSARRREHESEAARIALQSRGPSGPLDGVLRDERRRRVRQVLARLKPVQAQALILRASGFSYHEVAETLGVKRVSVGTLILRAEQAFRKHFRAVAGEKEEI